MMNKEELTIRPYARLLTMLGEQLIKNERIALIELIKNSYDADSPWVKVYFLGFKENYEKTIESKIIIEDSGCGMNAEILKNHWLNPATPEKKLRKENNPITKKGRVIQGDKGIGRFAILKLGRIIRVITRPEGENVEYILEYDLGKYDDEFLTENDKDKILYIDDIKVSLTSRKPETFIEESFSVGINKYKKKLHGTRIEISNLKGSWSDKKIKDIYGDITRLESIFGNKEKNESLSDKNSFQVWIFKDNDLQQYHEDYIGKLNNLLNDRAVFKIENGIFDDKKKVYSYLINGKQESLKLDVRDVGS